jgi:hypothetical protein
MPDVILCQTYNYHVKQKKYGRDFVHSMRTDSTGREKAFCPNLKTKCAY